MKSWLHSGHFAPFYLKFYPRINKIFIHSFFFFLSRKSWKGSGVSARVFFKGWHDLMDILWHKIINDCDRIRTQNYLNCKQTFSHFDWKFVWELSNCGFEYCDSHLNFRYQACFVEGFRQSHKKCRFFLNKPVCNFQSMNSSVELNSFFIEILLLWHLVWLETKMEALRKQAPFFKSYCFLKATDWKAYVAQLRKIVNFDVMVVRKWNLLLRLC